MADRIRFRIKRNHHHRVQRVGKRIIGQDAAIAIAIAIAIPSPRSCSNLTNGRIICATHFSCKEGFSTSHSKCDWLLWTKHNERGYKTIALLRNAQTAVNKRKRAISTSPDARSFWNVTYAILSLPKVDLSPFLPSINCNAAASHMKMASPQQHLSSSFRTRSKKMVTILVDWGIPEVADAFALEVFFSLFCLRFGLGKSYICKAV
eukprot:scaffold3241_cov125-Cylindrotheca_fusiformis.AAC.1